jgi:membrane protein YqaA with SNARE-associated domain
MQSWNPFYAYTALFVISLLASSVIPLGSEWFVITLLLAGYDTIAIVIVATLGNTLGAVTTYAVGLYGGHALAKRFLTMKSKDLNRAEKFYQRFGVWTLLFSWLPVIGDPFCAVSGFFETKLPLFTGLVLVGKLGRYAAVAWITTSFI